MILKIIMLVLFFGVMVGVGIYCRKNATDGLRRPVRLEVRYSLNMDWYRQRAYRLVFGVGNSRQTHEDYDSAPKLSHNARILRQAL